MATGCSTTTEFSAGHKDELSKIEKVIGKKLNKQEIQLLDSAETIRVIFDGIYAGKYDESKRNAKIVLETSGNTLEVYKFALMAFTLSEIFIFDADKEAPGIENLKNLDFNSFQNIQCHELCDSIGWKVLATYESQLFDPVGYNKYLISQNIFSVVNKSPPKWIDKVFLTQDISTESEEKNINAINDQEKYLFFADDAELFQNALKYFLEGKFEKSIEAFTNIAAYAVEPEILSRSYYWLGRNYLSLNQNEQAKKFFLLSGKSDPLSLYDSLSGQMLGYKSGKASTNLSSPFFKPWEEEYNKWLYYSDVFKKSDNQDGYIFDVEMEFIERTTIQAFLLSTKIMAKNNLNSLNDYKKYMVSNPNAIENFFTKDEIEWLKNRWVQVVSRWVGRPSVDVSTAIAWLVYSLGNDFDSAMFVSQTKNSFDLYSESNNFLYFVFYPKPQYEEVAKASMMCSIDPDLIYSIDRQEGFFKSKKSFNQLIDKSCLLQSLLKKYNNDIVKTFVSYKAGVAVMDELINKVQSKSKDDVVLLESIPNEEVRYFVQEALRDYYNIKWIYNMQR